VAIDENQRIRDLCIRVLNAMDADRESAIIALQSALRQYLEDQSDELVIAELLKIPDVAPSIRKKGNGKDNAA
jgi:hypothetical protein